MHKKRIAPSTKSGAHHWLMERFSAVALIPLTFWLVFSFVKIVEDPQGYLPVFFAYPLNAVLGILLIIASLYHGSLGMRVIFEDYISNKTQRHCCTMLTHFISITTAVAAVIAIVRLHLIG